MRQIVRRFFNHSGEERALLLQALIHLMVIKLGVVVLPFKIMHRLVSALVPEDNRSISGDTGEIDRVIWAIRAASHYVPRATCLPQALATQVMLGRRGYSTQLCIGFMQDNDTGRLKGHAWVERQGQILIGDIGVSQFTLLTSLEQSR
ncbi:MAG: lasso peptide biosynthesis B2 protein [Anaerolineae bacterium]|nr:lasso peptide biosynthesis B2 protein [Anaerolineae bacterium]